MPFRSAPNLFLALLVGWILCTAAPALAAKGIDTASGVSNLPFNIEGVPVMNMTANGLGIGIGTATPFTTLQVRTGTNQDFLFASHNNLSSGIDIAAVNDTNSANIPLEFDASQFGFFGGDVGIGVNNPSYPLQISTSSPIGMYLSEAGNNSHGIEVDDTGTNSDAIVGNATGTGSNGIFGSGVNVGVYGTSGASGYGVYGNNTSSGFGVYGSSTSSWAGVFEGAYGVYGQSSGSGWAGEFNSTTSPNGVWIGNNDNNAQLCLNGTCVTSLSSVGNTVQLGAFGPGAKVGPYAFCALSGIGNPGGTDVSVNVCGGSAGAYYWCTTAQSPVQTIELSCF